MNNQYSAAIIGCGMIAGQFQKKIDEYAYSHAKALFNNYQFREIGYFDINTTASRKLAKEFPGINFESLEHMIEAMHPDLVSICSPDDCHYQQITELLEHKLCPKVIFV